MPASPQDLTAIIRKTLNDDIAEFLPVKQGLENEVYNLKTKRGKNVFIRIKQKDTTGFKQEAWAMQKANSLGVPVPHVYAVENFEIANELKEVLVVQKAEGTSLAEVKLEPPQLQQVCKNLGRVISKLHSESMTGFGFLEAENTWQFESWESFVAGTLQEREGDAPFVVQAGLSENEVSSLLQLISEMKVQEPQKSVLCHSDISFSHLFVDEDLNITALIDWGMCRGDVRALDIAGLLTYHPELELSWMLQGYAPEISEKDFRQEILVQQANALVAMMAYAVREGYQDDLGQMAAEARAVLQHWQTF
jgi:aminoglycoside phosphotransferase (APT) family kinase protein